MLELVAAVDAVRAAGVDCAGLRIVATRTEPAALANIDELSLVTGLDVVACVPD